MLLSSIAECAPPPTMDTPKLVQQDRCDRCSAQALVRVRMPSGSLLDFCGHDYRKHELALLAQDGKVVEVVPAERSAW